MDKTLSLGLATLLIFGGGGYLLIENVQNNDFGEVLLGGSALGTQLAVGGGYGLLSGMLALAIIRRDFFKKERQFYHQLVSQLRLNLTKIIFISLCAGIGEELFFRAGLQPLLGLWPTSIIFVLIHGYLNPANWRISVYGIFMVFIIAGMGYLNHKIGLISAMLAHAVLDVVLFMDLWKKGEMS
ncbi:MAG: CPBP family intramembrane glutamic endopeptidase [Cyclobacteriaceae bacterium]